MRNASPPASSTPIAPCPMSCGPGWLLSPCAHGARAHVLVHWHLRPDTHAHAPTWDGAGAKGVLLHARARCCRLSLSPIWHSSGTVLAHSFPTSWPAQPGAVAPAGTLSASRRLLERPNGYALRRQLGSWEDPGLLCKPPAPPHCFSHRTTWLVTGGDDCFI